jgi:hypothetical protein
MRHDGIYEDDAGLVFTGTPKEVVEWLDSHPSANMRKIYVGETYRVLTVPDYLAEKRYEDVLELVKVAMEKQKDATFLRGWIYIDDGVAAETARKITEIF